MTVALVSASINDKLKGITMTAVTSARASVPEATIRVYETSGLRVDYPGAEVVPYEGEFVYNRVLNQAIRECQTPYIALCNNDLYFHRDWYRRCREVMDQGGYLSCSPAGKGCRVGYLSPYQHREGYGIGQELCGWCLLVRRDLFDRIGALDEGCEFWYSDNIYVDQLKAEGITHVLVGGRLVDHLESVTLKTRTQGDQQRMTQLQKRVYDGLRKKYHTGNPGIL